MTRTTTVSPSWNPSVFVSMSSRSTRLVYRCTSTPSAIDGCHHLTHLQIVEEAETARFAGLGAVAKPQVLWDCHEAPLEELALPFLRGSAEAGHYPFGDLVRHGARLAAGSDSPVSSADPMDAIHIAVNRVTPGSGDKPLGGAHQRLDITAARAAYTSSTACVNHRENDTGSIREGYLANLVVLHPDSFALPVEEIHRSTVVSARIEGKSVYSTPTDPCKEASRRQHTPPREPVVCGSVHGTIPPAGADI